MHRTLTRALFLLVFFSCSSSTPWQVSHLKGSKKEFDSARLIYPIHDIVNGLAVEMIYSKDDLRTYLTVHSQKIPPYKGNPKEALVILKTMDQTIQGVGYRHEGGQRVVLSSDLQQILIEHLLSENSVTVELQGYSTTLSHEQFLNEYRKLQKAPLNIPVQLPFKLS